MRELLHQGIDLAGLWLVTSLVFRALDTVIRRHIDWVARHRAIRDVLLESHRWDRWAKYHTENRP